MFFQVRHTHNEGQQKITDFFYHINFYLKRTILNISFLNFSNFTSFPQNLEKLSMLIFWWIFKCRLSCFTWKHQKYPHINVLDKWTQISVSPKYSFPHSYNSQFYGFSSKLKKTRKLSKLQWKPIRRRA